MTAEEQQQQPGGGEVPLSDFDPKATGLGPDDIAGMFGMSQDQMQGELGAAEQIDPALNGEIATLVATLAYKSAPASDIVALGMKPTPRSLVAQRYVDQVTPWLKLIRFHETLGVLVTLSPTARLALGVLVLGGSIVAIRVPKEIVEIEERERKAQEEAAESEKDND